MEYSYKLSVLSLSLKMSQESIYAQFPISVATCLYTDFYYLGFEFMRWSELQQDKLTNQNKSALRREQALQGPGTLQNSPETKHTLKRRGSTVHVILSPTT